MASVGTEYAQAIVEVTCVRFREREKRERERKSSPRYHEKVKRRRVCEVHGRIKYRLRVALQRFDRYVCACVARVANDIESRNAIIHGHQ